jgi:hypothetical protein
VRLSDRERPPFADVRNTSDHSSIDQKELRAPRRTPNTTEGNIMKLITLAVVAAALFTGTTALSAQEMPKMPEPTKEHIWLQQFVGEWETEAEITMDPSQPPMKGKGTESVRALGGFWVVGEGTGTMEGMPGTMKSVLTLGYDPAAKKYIGSWIDSMTSTYWKYEGSVDASGKTLTLDTEGPCPMKPGLVKFKEVTEFKDKDHRVFTSSILGDDGKWTKMVTVNYRRKK